MLCVKAHAKCVLYLPAFTLAKIPVKSAFGIIPVLQMQRLGSKSLNQLPEVTRREVSDSETKLN